MGSIHAPSPVIAIVAVISRYDAAFEWARRQIEKEFAPVQLASEAFPFDQTDYYTDTMGDQLRKQFLVPAGLFDPGELARWKIKTNAWEAEFRRELDREQPASELRPLNLDPGYLSLGKLVLASTKNHAHRLYLSDGIFAEITLQYRDRRWQTCPWTYPDYCQPEFHAFFDTARDYLRQCLRARPPEAPS